MWVLSWRWMKIATVLAVGGLVVGGSRLWDYKQQSSVGQSMSWSTASWWEPQTPQNVTDDAHVCEELAQGNLPGSKTSESQTLDLSNHTPSALTITPPCHTLLLALQLNISWLLFTGIEPSRQSDWDGVVACHRGEVAATTWNFNRSTMGSHRLQHQRFNDQHKLRQRAIALAWIYLFILLLHKRTCLRSCFSVKLTPTFIDSELLSDYPCRLWLVI